MGFVEYIYFVLVEVDYWKWIVKVIFIFVFFLFFVVLYVLIGFVFMIIWIYWNLCEKEKMFWKLVVVCVMYGIFCMVVGVWVIFVDMELEKDLVFVIFFISYFVFIVIVGFFVFECGVILILDIVYRKVSIFLNIYYWLLFFGYLILMVMEVVYCFGIKGFILEMSMLFFVICWIVLKVGKVDFLFWYVN